MTLSQTNLHSDDLKETIKLYRIINQLDIIRNMQKPVLNLVGTFKAAIEDNNFTKPVNIVAEIYNLKKVFLRVSDFYRQEFIKNNYIRHQGKLMRIASASYYRLSGILCCICYDVDDF